jgi:hypothetical protein
MDRSMRLWGASVGKNELAHSSLRGLTINPNVRTLGPPVKREALSDTLFEVKKILLILFILSNSLLCDLCVSSECSERVVNPFSSFRGFFFFVFS